MRYGPDINFVLLDKIPGIYVYTSLYMHYILLSGAPKHKRYKIIFKTKSLNDYISIMNTNFLK